MTAITIIIGIIFILLIIIFLVYFFYYNRVDLPKSTITDTGFALRNSNNLYITLETIFTSSPGRERTLEPTLTLQTIPSGQFINSSQGWSFQEQNGDPVSILGTGQSNITPSGTKVCVKSNYTDGYVTYDILAGSNNTKITGNLRASSPTFDNSLTRFFTLEYDNNNPSVIALKSDLTPINGQEQYIIPGSVLVTGSTSISAIGVTIGIPNNTSDKFWTIV